MNPDSVFTELARFDVGPDRDIVVEFVETPGHDPALKIISDREGRPPIHIFIPGRYVPDLLDGIARWERSRGSTTEDHSRAVPRR